MKELQNKLQSQEEGTRRMTDKIKRGFIKLEDR